MMNKIMPALIGLFFFLMFVFAIYETAKKDNERHRACKEKGMIYVQPFKQRGYCAQGFVP